jgi:murein DD-endopeptidase MepM/ murein hydrolase activator NlpD
MAQAPVPQPPPSPQTIAVPQRTMASGAVPPQTIFSAPQQAGAARPEPAQPAAPPAQMAAAPQQSVTPPPSAAKVLPDIIPLDDPPPGKERTATGAPPPAAPPQGAVQINAQASGAPSVLPLRNPAAAPPPTGDDSSQPAGAAAAPAATAEAGGRFPWPVRGRILASYGNTPGGGHNDGINIAAPRGTPVRAIEGGTVAYAGNEVKGYGNIVLIKHPDGWISAYAHLDDVTVKPGDTIAAGQVIGKVGESGGVGEPQLHFELRRGKKPVNPTQFLAPAPSAAAPAGNGAG